MISEFVFYLIFTISEPICMDDAKLVEMIKSHEGVREKPYTDTVGKLTIGVGRNLTDRGMTISTIDAMLAEDITLAKSELDKKFPKLL